MSLVQLLVLAPLLVGYLRSEPVILTEEAHVSEDVPKGNFAFQINATGTNLVYSISGTNSFYFSVNPTTGIVIVNSPLDRETLPVIMLNIEVSKGMEPKPIPVFVEDANDNPPIFHNAPYNVDVLENAAIDEIIFRASVTDADFNTAAVVTYTISEAVPQEGLELFSISPSNGAVKLTGALNYTSKSSFYRLIINATDGGGPSNGEIVYLWSTAVAFITVIDVPDLDPQFLRLPYLTSVQENTAVGHTVFKVQAIDPDTGINDVIVYSIAGTNAPDLFTIDQNTGEITVNTLFDREKLLDIEATVVLRVMATESKQNVNGILASTVAEVRISIGDINDNKPLFYTCDAEPCDFATLTDSFNASVDEHSSMGVPVANLKMGVRDLDALENARFKLHLEGPAKDLFSVAPPSAAPSSIVQILIAKSRDVDYEKNKTMALQVVATDMSKPKDCCSTATVTIQINDINDNIPAFKNQSYDLAVKEHSDVGTIVAIITATDPDTQDEGNIIYKLAPESILKFFTVDPKSGTIMVNTDNLDREARTFYSASLQATDSANNMGSTALEITLLDINDNAPEMARAVYTEFMVEGPEGKLHVQIQARDDDEEGTNNSKIRYQIMPSEFSPNFTIDESTGVLENNGPLDREAIDLSADGVIELNVTASDMGDPIRSSHATVLINVEDINDNAPEFIRHDYKFYVKESDKGAFVGSVSAVDGDQTVFNNRISFQITDGGLGNFIILSLAEGEGKGYLGNISVDPDVELDYEERKAPYIFKVAATDLGQRKDVAEVEVHVVDVNDERPEFPAGASVRVSENTPEGGIGAVVGTDVDGNHSLTYELLSTECRCGGVTGPCAEEWFTLLPSGEVVVNPNVTVDYETCDLVVMEAQVVDIFTEKGLNNSLPGQLEIYIEDLNDNIPQFIVSEALFVVVTESTEKGTSVASVTATDRDSGKNKEIVFQVLKVEFIDTNNITNLKEIIFSVDAVEEEDSYVGTIRSIASLNSDLKGKYLVTVEAADSAPQFQMKNSTQLEIYTIDESFRVGLRFESTEAEVNKNMNQIRGALTSATKATVHIMKVVAETAEQRNTQAVTLLEAYFVYPNGSALNSESVEKILQEDLYNANILRQYGLTVIVAGGTDPTAVDPVRFVLLGLVAGLMIILVVMITSLVCTQRNYKRKLKAAKALNMAAMTTENQKSSAMVPGTNKYTMQENPVLNLNIDATMDLGFDEEDSSTDRMSVNSLDYNIDVNMVESDNMPMMVIEEENEDTEEPLYIMPLDAALADRRDKRKFPKDSHSCDNPSLDTTDL